ncbi:hypothetical protein, partial [Desulfobacula sp.]|uniref:hypothetical protein n=1 Tax=Desulfobacula sp. TaxID=2593537 RepID=UPI00262FC379
MKKVLQCLHSNRESILSSLSKKNNSLIHGSEIAERFISGFTRVIQAEPIPLAVDPFIQIIFRLMDQNLLDLPQVVRLISTLRTVFFDIFHQHLPHETDGLQHLNFYLDDALEKTALKFDRHIKRQVIQMETSGKTTVNFTSKKKRGWLDLAGTRMCMLDISGGWLDLWRSISLFVGEDTAKRVFFEAGLAEIFSRTALKKGILNHTAESFKAAVDTYSEAGFGDFQIKALSFKKGYARITCPDTFEGWAFLK